MMPGMRRAIRIASGLLLLMVVAASGIAVRYRQVYNVWPGQRASARVHWCGRDYENSGAAQTWQQIFSHQPWPIHAAGHYPPLGWPSQELFAATIPAGLRHSAHPPASCAVVVYLRTGAGRYKAYSLEGGP